MMGKGWWDGWTDKKSEEESPGEEIVQVKKRVQVKK